MRARTRIPPRERRSLAEQRRGLHHHPLEDGARVPPCGDPGPQRRGERDGADLAGAPLGRPSLG
eukprot:12733049-Alexandrium_andersonii.AAC.1